MSKNLHIVSFLSLLTKPINGRTGSVPSLTVEKHICKERYLLRIRDLMRRRQWNPTPVLLPGKSHGWRSLAGCSPQDREESDTTERFHFDFSLSCIGEGNDNPLQCSCLENPREEGAWWAAVYGITHSRTGLKRLSSSSSRDLMNSNAQFQFSIPFISAFID